LLLIAIASTDFGQALPIVLVALSLITIVFFGPLLLPSLLCIRITDDALEIVSPFWIQRVAWTDIERFTSVDFDLHTTLVSFPVPPLIGYVLSPKAFHVRPPLGWRSCREYDCHGMFWVPDGVSRQTLVTELRRFIDRRTSTHELP
jgi:hypothetical protein